jgi:DNA-binding CsgD family transcriptional regulator
MTSLYLYLIHSGANGVQTQENAKRIILSNKLAFSCAMISAPFILLFFVQKIYILSLLLIPMILTYYIIIMLNRFYFFVLSRISLILCMNLFVLFMASALGRECGTQFGFFSLIPVGYALFEKNRNGSRLLSSALPLLLLILLETFNYPSFISIHIQHPAIIFNCMLLATSCLLIMILFFLTQLHEDSKNEIKTMRTIFKLTSKEWEIVQLVSLGKRNHDIGNELFITEGTVKNHLKRIYKKMNVTSRFELMTKVSG